MLKDGIKGLIISLKTLGIYCHKYAWTPKSEEEVSYMMLKVLDKLYEELQLSTNCPAKWYNTHASLEQEVRHRMLFYGVSREEAIVLLVLSILQGLSKDEIKLNKPHYGKKEHFRMGSLIGKTPISMTYKEMNNRAIKMFG